MKGVRRPSMQDHAQNASIGALRLIVSTLAAVTRRFHPRGTDRVLRLVHNPDDRPWSIRTEVEIKRYHQRFHVDTRSFLEWSLFFYGAYEAEVLRVIEKSLALSDGAIDVGANVGIHSAVMASCVGPGGKVLSLEPNTAVAERLRQNLALNKLSHVDVREVAASDTVGTATLWLPSDHEANQGTATMVPNTGVAKLVRTARLDDLWELSNLRLVKIDTEGWEFPVLRGAERLLRSHHPRLLFEFAPETWSAAGCQWRECADYLLALGYYSLAIVKRDGLEVLAGEPDRYVMVVAD